MARTSVGAWTSCRQAEFRPTLPIPDRRGPAHAQVRRNPRRALGPCHLRDPTDRGAFGPPEAFPMSTSPTTDPAASPPGSLDQSPNRVGLVPPPSSTHDSCSYWINSGVTSSYPLQAPTRTRTSHRAHLRLVTRCCLPWRPRGRRLPTTPVGPRRPSPPFIAEPLLCEPRKFFFFPASRIRPCDGFAFIVAVLRPGRTLQPASRRCA